MTPNAGWSIVWPAAGFPALIEPGNRSLELIAASRSGGVDTLREWARHVGLRNRRTDTTVAIDADRAELVSLDEVADRAGQFAALPAVEGLRFGRVRLRVPSLPAATGQQTFDLFDVTVRGLVERARSAAIYRAESTTLNFAFASDLHMAARWDDVADAVARHAPELERSFHHPHRLLDRFIAEANRLAARGALDLVVFGGDLVDHVHPTSHRSHNGAATNIDLLLSRLARLDVPSLAVAGNHDHRAFPWRPRFYGLEVVGLPWAQAKPLLRKSGMWDRWPLRPSDIDALRTLDGAASPAMSDYLTRIAPVTDYACSVRGTRLLCVSTGCDVLSRWRRLEMSRWGLFLHGLRDAWRHPDSEGFSNEQAARIAGWLRDGPVAALFCHAPLLAPTAGMPLNQRLVQLDPEWPASLAAQKRSERRWQRTGLRGGVAFRNAGVLIHALASAANPVAAFAGHVHRASALELDRAARCVRAIDMRQLARRPENTMLLTAPAVGQARAGSGQRPGYLLARCVDGEVVSVEPCELDGGL